MKLTNIIVNLLTIDMSVSFHPACMKNWSGCTCYRDDDVCIFHCLFYSPTCSALYFFGTTFSTLICSGPYCYLVLYRNKERFRLYYNITFN